MKTNLYLVKIDETQYWRTEFLKRINSGRISHYYIFDANRPTNCCEITASYWLESVYDQTENWIEDKDWEDFMNESDRDGCYMHCKDVEKLPSEKLENDFEYEDDDEYNSEMESVVDYERGNQIEIVDHNGRR